jgi:hypothetical protein
MSSEDADVMLTDPYNVNTFLASKYGVRSHITKIGPQMRDIQHGDRKAEIAYYVLEENPHRPEDAIKRQEKIFLERGGESGYNNILFRDDHNGALCAMALLYIS